MSFLTQVLRSSSPSAPSAGQIQQYGLTSDKLQRYIDENGVIRKNGSFFMNSNTGDLGPTAGANFYLASSAVPVAQLVAGSVIRWKIGMTKTAACTGTPALQVVLGTAQTTADPVIATATGVAQTAATDTAVLEIEMIVRALTASAAAAWFMRFAHKNATTGFANAAQEQIFNGTTANQNWTTAGLYLGVMINPTATGANGVWTFQTCSVMVGIA